MSGLGLYHRGFLKVLHLRVLALPSRMTLLIVGLFVLQGISKTSEPPSRLALIVGAWFILHWISKNSEFAGVGSAVDVGFD